MPNTAHFISFEGGEGGGKSTQVQLLAEWLQQRGVPCLITREPGGTANGEDIRALFVSGRPDRWDALCELYLLNAARRDHVLRVIKPTLASGTWVVCDRYVDSTRIYQGVVKGLSDTTILRHHREATDDLWPDLTFILDVDPNLGLNRARARAHQSSHKADEMRFEAETYSFHEQLRSGYRALAESEPKRCLLIDANLPTEQVFENLIKAIPPHLKSRLYL